MRVYRQSLCQNLQLDKGFLFGMSCSKTQGELELLCVKKEITNMITKITKLKNFGIFHDFLGSPIYQNLRNSILYTDGIEAVKRRFPAFLPVARKEFYTTKKNLSNIQKTEYLKSCHVMG